MHYWFKLLIKFILLSVLLSVSFFNFANAEKKGIQIFKDNKIQILNIDKEYSLYSPINGHLIYSNGHFYLFNKNKNIVIDLLWLQNHHKIWLIQKWEKLWQTYKNKWSVSVKLFSLPQNYNVNVFFFNLLLKKNIQQLDLKYNKIPFKNKVKNDYYYDEYYDKFYEWLHFYASNSVLTEIELLSYKLTTDYKFINIINQYNINNLNLTPKQKILYNDYYKFSSCLYNKQVNTCKEEFPNEYKSYNEKITNIYWNIYFDQDKLYMKKIINKNWQKNIKWYTIPKWQINIYKNKNINKSYFLTLAAINKQECWRLDWACLSKWDAWPFQINFIHKKDYYKSKKLVYEIRNEKDNKIKQTKIENLFNFQLDWTINRLNILSQKFCKNQKWDNLSKCMAILHNWNTSKTCYKWWKFTDFRYCYADSVVSIKNNFRKKYNLY